MRSAPDFSDSIGQGRGVAPSRWPGWGGTGIMIAVADSGASRWQQVVRSIRALGPEDTQPLPRIGVEPPPVPVGLIELLKVLGVAMLAGAESAGTVTRTLEDVAAAYDVDAQALVLPTSIVIRVGASQVDLVPAPNRPLLLDQVAELTKVIELLQRAAVTPAEGLMLLERALRTRPRFGTGWTIVGHMVLSVGIGLVIGPELYALPAYAVLGALVAVLVLSARRWPTLAVALPVVAAVLVTVLAVRLIAPLTDVDTFRLLAPPLVSLLPGAALTLATIELTTDQMVAGASRLVWGIAQLLLLTFGILVGLGLAGSPPRGTGATQLGLWAPWLGVAIVAVGFLLYSSAPRGSLVYLLVALYAAYGAQTLGATLLGPLLSGFAGGLVIVPLSELLARLRNAPPAAVLLLPAFWILVPGALGLRGLSQLATGLGAANVTSTVIALFAIALGILVGSSLTRDARTVRRTWRTGGP